MSENLLRPPRSSAGGAPLRIPRSIRRTSSIDVSWPHGQAEGSLLAGRARDIFTPSSEGSLVVCAEDSFEVELQPDRRIISINASPPRPALSQLIGTRAGNRLRQQLTEVARDELHNATPLYLILDDIPGASFVSEWTWSLWNPNYLAELMASDNWEESFQTRQGVCAGFSPGSSASDPITDQSGAPVPDLRNPDDPEGWHLFTAQDGIGMRRARRIDMWLDEVIVIDSAFQDSATTPNGGRIAMHEYCLRVTADPRTNRVLSIEAEPRVLPFVECVSAVPNLSRLIGSTLTELREKVLAEFRGTVGCTHLNDALRALADVPMLRRYLD